MPFSGGNRAEIPQKKNLDRQADRFDGDLGHKKHKNRLSESVDRKTKKLDRRADRQSADLVFWDTLFGFLGHSRGSSITLFDDVAVCVVLPG